MAKNLSYKLFFLLMTVLMFLAVKSLNLSESIWDCLIWIFFGTTLLCFFYIMEVVDIGKDERKLLGFTIVFAVIVRVFMYNLLKTEQTSDFGAINWFYENYKQRGAYQNGSSLDFFQVYYAKFPAWFTYMQIVRGIYAIAGMKTEVIIYLNIFLNCITMLLLYKTVCIYFDKKIALLSLILFGFCPSIVLYTCLMTPDHFSMLIMAGIMFAWSKMQYYREKNSEKKYMIYMVAIIILCSVLNLFKPLNILMLMVFICAEIAVIILPGIKDIKNIIKNNYKFYLLFLLLFFIITSLFSIVEKQAVKGFFKVEVVGATYLYILAGFPIDEQGNLNENFKQETSEALTNKYGDEYSGRTDALEIVRKKSEEAKILLQNRIKKNLKYMPKILLDKFNLLFSGDDQYFYWTNTSEIAGYQDALNKVLYKPILSGLNIWMCVMYISVFISCFIQIFAKKPNYILCVLAVMIFGYISVLLLSVVQQRYKSIIMPQLSVIAAYGLYEGKNIVRKAYEYLKSGKKQSKYGT